MSYLFAFCISNESRYIRGRGDNIGACRLNAILNMQRREMKRIGRFKYTDISVKVDGRWTKI